MSIFSALDNAFGTHSASKRLGENGSVEHTMVGMAGNNSTLQGAIVAANGGLVRTSATEETVQDHVRNIMTSATHSQKQWATATCLVMGMNIRDTRGGKGEKDLSRWWFKAMYDYCPTTVANLVMLFPEYGYWKDLTLLLAEISPPKSDRTRATRLQYQKWDILRNSIYDEMVLQFNQDLDGLETDDPKLSLLVKYIPKEARSFDKKFGMAKELAKRIYPEEFKDDFKKAMGLYRRDCGTINEAIHTTERLMSDGRWDQIKFKMVPSACLFRNKKAFLNEKKKGDEFRHPHDAIRNQCRENLRTHVELALQGKVTISGKQLGLHEFVGAIMENSTYSYQYTPKTISVDERKLIVAQWNTKRSELISNLECEFGVGKVPLRRIITMIDTSGSMWSFDNGMPGKVAYGIGIMMSEVLAHFDKTLGNRVMTYHSTPTWVEFKDGWDFIRKVEHLSSAPWGGSTNYLGAHQLLLDLRRRHGIPNDRMPTDILVVSDMQFNGTGGDLTTHQQIKRMYSSIDCAVPNTTYWNVRTTGGSPVQSDTTGTQYISGFSLDILKYVLNAGKGGVDGPTQVTPWDTAIEMITDRRYELVHKVIETTQETGVFDGYVAPTYKEIVDGEVKPSKHSTVEKQIRDRLSGSDVVDGGGAGADDDSFEVVVAPSVTDELEALKAQLKTATDAIAGLTGKLASLSD